MTYIAKIRNKLHFYFFKLLKIIARLSRTKLYIFDDNKFNSFIFLSNKYVIQKESEITSKDWNSLESKIKNEFLLNGKIEFTNYFFERLDGTEIIYQKKVINKFIRKAKQNKCLYYGETDKYLYDCLNKYNINSKEVALMGSTVPWYEAIVLSRNGVPYTIEYNKIKTDDSRLNVFSFENWNKINKKFDFIFSISSFEHDGLGRYGDPINPNGDIEAMKNVYENLLSKNGFLILSVPIGKDQLAFNAHRIYGKERFKMLIQGFNIVDSFFH